MQKRRRKNKKNIVTVYIARAIVTLVLTIMIVLMFCGCLYIRDLFRKDDTSGSKTDIAADADVNSNKDNDTTKKEDKPDPEYSVVIDAGHGGYDGGTLNGDIIEKSINLSVAFELRSILEEQNIEVIMTRTTDDFVSLDDRIFIANQAATDLFVSVHCNFFEGDNSVDGLEVFYCPKAEGGKKLAENIADSARQMDEIAVRGATENMYYVTRHTTMDAVLIEMGFLSNDIECQKLASTSYQKVLAQAIADGIVQTLENNSSASPESEMD